MHRRSHAVIGAIGIVLGSIVAAIAVIWASISYGISTEEIVIGGVVVAGFIGVAKYILNESAKPAAKTPSAPDQTTPAYREALASLEFRARARRNRASLNS